MKIAGAMRVAGLAAAMLGVALTHAARPYEPVISNPVTQDHAWSWIEELGDLKLRCVDVGLDGRLWLGTGDGIASYDGRSVTLYGEAEGVVGGIALDMLTASDGSIYSFRRSAILRYRDERWQVIYEGGISPESMELAVEGADGTIWAAGEQGIFQIEGDRVLLHSSEGETLSTVFEDHDGFLWTAVLDDGTTYRIGRQNGMLAKKPDWEKLMDKTAHRSSRYGFAQSLDGLIWRFSTDPDDPTWFYDLRVEHWELVDFEVFGVSNQVQAQYRTRDGTLWAVSDGVLHGRVDGRWSIHRPLSSRHGPMRANLAEAPNGDLWLLDYHVSLVRIDYSGRRWSVFEGLLFQFETEAGAAWFLSEWGEIVHRDGTEWYAYGREDGVMDSPLALIRLRSGAVWAVGSDKGAAAVSIFEEGSWQTKRHSAAGTSYFEDAWHELPNGEILLCTFRRQHWTYSETGAMVRVSAAGDLIRDSVRHVEEIPSRAVGLEPNPKGGLTLNEGYSLWEWEDGQLRRSDLMKADGMYWIDDFLYALDDSLWVANWGSGVKRLAAGEPTVSYAERDGLSSRFVSQLHIDPRTNTLFVLTSEGLDRFDGHQWQAVGGAKDLVNNRDATYLKSGAEGELWIAQGARPWFFRPFNGGEYKRPPGEFFRSLVYRTDKEPPETNLMAAHLPTLSDRGLSVSWWGSDPWNETSVRDLRYSYRIDGGAWSEFSSERLHSFHQLDDGPHVMEVRARDQDLNVDPSPARLEFSIPPPLWRQDWFLALVLLIVLLIAALLIVIFRQRWLHLVAYDAQRLSFFTNISHELRTPLALILAPLEKAIGTVENTGQERNIGLALRSAKRLNQLVDQLLDFRRIESGAMELSRSDGDLVAQLEDLVDSFQSLAETKQQVLVFKCLEDDWLASYDSDKLQKVVSNLVANALKYTQAGGRVKVTLEIQPKRPGGRRCRARICVEDNGPGISAKRQGFIFQPFYRGGAEVTKDAVGTGLGLSLTKQLVSLMEGEIVVQSPLNEVSKEHPGTEFRVVLPLWDSSVRESAGSDEAAEEDAAESRVASEVLGAGELRILLIDDNEDIRDFLGRELAERYEVVLAADGQDGLEKAREQVPDLVIADVMMPRMDGYEFCRELKGNVATSHIPVILLTARSSKAFEEKGLEAGADEYLTKPIAMKTLELRIANLLETRSRLQQRLRARVISEPTEVAPARAPVSEKLKREEVFVTRLASLLEENLREGKYGVDELAESLGMSRSSFYRKLKAISGETPNDFIRRFRLERAGQLLRGTSLSVTDVMYEVGYQELGHFGKLFKAHFGCSPSEHRSVKAG